jgi:hypothetical protein
MDLPSHAYGASPVSAFLFPRVISFDNDAVTLNCCAPLQKYTVAPTAKGGLNAM